MTLVLASRKLPRFGGLATLIECVEFRRTQ